MLQLNLGLNLKNGKGFDYRQYLAKILINRPVFDYFRKMHLNPDPKPIQGKIKLTEKLLAIISNLPNEKLTLSEIRELLGRDGLLIFAALLALVFLIPVSIPGVSTVFGATIMMIGVSLIFGFNLWLPPKFLKKEIPAKKLQNGFNVGLKWFSRIEKISKPRRLMWLTNNRPAEIANGSAIVFGAALLMLPFGLIPFSNTLPAMAILFYSIGMLQNDGISVLLGYVLNIVSSIYFAVLISGGGLAISGFLQYLNI